MKASSDTGSTGVSSNSSSAGSAVDKLSSKTGSTLGLSHPATTPRPSSMSSSSSSSLSLPSSGSIMNLSHKNLTSQDLLQIYQQYCQAPTTTSSSSSPLSPSSPSTRNTDGNNTPEVFHFHTLKLGFNNLRDEGAQLIANWMQSYSSLTCLDLGFCSIGDVGVEALSSMLATHPSLKKLYLSGNQMTHEGFRSLSAALAVNKTLTALYMTANNGEAEGAKWIAKGLRYNTMLDTLIINGNNLDRDGASCIADTLAMNHAITHLNLSDNGIGDSGLASLSEAMASHRNLKILELSFNKLTHVGIGSFIDHLVGYNALRRLLLDNNKLQDAGAKSLSLALPHLQIEELNISFNEIGSPGLTSIIQCIQSSRTVKSLWLSGNVIDNDVAKILATMLLKNTILQVLYMDHCSITTVGERFIGTGIASNKKCVLNVLTGFELAKVLVLLGSPAQIGELSNDSALKYLHQMWLHVERNNLSPTNPGNNTAVSSSPASSVQSNDIPIVHQQPSPRHESLHPVGPGTGGNSQHHVHYASDVPTPPVNPNPTNVDGDTGAVPPPINDDDYDGENSMGSDYDDDIDDDSYSDESYVSNSDRSDTSSHFDHRYDQYYTYNYPKPVEPTLANEGMHPNIANSAVAQEVSRADLDAIASAMPPITPREDQSQLPHTNSGGRGRARSRTQSGHANSGERLRSISRSQSRGNISEGEDVVRLRTYIVNPEVVDVAKKIAAIPFSAAELWELHQYYNSPPPTTSNNSRFYSSRDDVDKSFAYHTPVHDKSRLSNRHSRPHLDLEEDGCGERPHKKPSNIHTMARINLYSKIKIILDEYKESVDDVKTLCLLRRLRYLEDCSGVYDVSTIESILLYDIMQYSSSSSAMNNTATARVPSIA